MPRDKTQPGRRAAGLLARIQGRPSFVAIGALAVLAVLAMGPGTFAQPPTYTADAFQELYGQDWEMGLILSARGERLMFSGASFTNTHLVLRNPAIFFGWETWILARGGGAVALGDMEVAAYDASESEVKLVPWADGGAPDFADADIWPGCGEALALAGNRMVSGCATRDLARGQAKISSRSLQTGSWVWSDEWVTTGSAPGAQLGAAVAHDGNTVAIGEPHEISGQTGRVHIRRRLGSFWIDAGTLEAGDQEAGNAFGAALALSGDWLAVGAPLDDTAPLFPLATDVGSVRLYKKTGIIGGFSWVATLYGADSGDHFGASLAMTETTLVVGAPGVNGFGAFVDLGRAYAYWRSGELWTYSARLGASSAWLLDRFGTTVGILNAGIVVGAPGHDATFPNSGGIYFFPGLVPLFTGGFESGGTSEWSATVP